MERGNEEEKGKQMKENSCSIDGRSMVRKVMSVGAFRARARCQGRPRTEPPMEHEEEHSRQRTAPTLMSQSMHDTLCTKLHIR